VKGSSGGHDPSRVAVIGSGYVGTVVAACLAALGRQVVGVEIDLDRLRSLRAGRVPFHEAGLEALLEAAQAAGLLRFTDDAARAVAHANVVFVCVAAPGRADGTIDAGPLERAVEMARPWRPGQVVVVKSTAPVGTARRLAHRVRPRRVNGQGLPAVVVNPEFLREGSAVEDFLHPDRIVLGSDDAWAVDRVAEVYRPVLDQTFPGGDPGRRPIFVRTTPESAELAKFAANAFLAAKVSFANEIAGVCEAVGAHLDEVIRVMGLDHRIGAAFLGAGLGWGGSCLGKDLAGLITTAAAAERAAPLLRAVAEVNHRQRTSVLRRLERDLTGLTGKVVTLLGLAFKPGTDDIRDAPSIHLGEALLGAGATVRAHDPVVRALPRGADVEVVGDPYLAAEGADAVVGVTEWPQYRALDLARLRAGMRGDVLFDGRRLFDPRAAEHAGFRYGAVGHAPRREVDLRDGATRAASASGPGI
jgi:UDPglucose 6-dehydrogenase